MSLISGSRGPHIVSLRNSLGANLACDTPLTVRQPTLLKGTKLGLRNRKGVSQARKCLLILMKEADVDQMGQEDMHV